MDGEGEGQVSIEEGLVVFGLFRFWRCLLGIGEVRSKKCTLLSECTVVSWSGRAVVGARAWEAEALGSGHNSLLLSCAIVCPCTIGGAA